jgi:hypothetical protein
MTTNRAPRPALTLDSLAATILADLHTSPRDDLAITLRDSCNNDRATMTAIIIDECANDDMTINIFADADDDELFDSLLALLADPMLAAMIRTALDDLIPA